MAGAVDPVAGKVKIVERRRDTSGKVLEGAREEMAHGLWCTQDREVQERRLLGIRVAKVLWEEFVKPFERDANRRVVGELHQWAGVIEVALDDAELLVLQIVLELVQVIERPAHIT